MEELYKKYRPNQFADFLGNDENITALRNELSSGSRSFLFSGESGTGKTTLARLIAKELLIANMDIIEINSADNRGIDTARQIIEESKYLPLNSTWKLYILDECHKWTSDMQSAMLKVLEDIPKTCIFILCTTDPQKLITPIKNRCSVYRIKPLQQDDMCFLIKKVSKLENIKLDSSVNDKIVELSNGCPRKALKLLNKVLKLDCESAIEILNKESLIDADVELIAFCRELVKRTDSKTLCKIYKTISNYEPETVRQTVMGYCSAIMMNGNLNKEVTATLQAFLNADTIKSGKNAILGAIIDRDLCMKY